MFKKYCRNNWHFNTTARCLKLILALLIINTFTATAQDFYGESSQTYGVGLSADYDMPARNLKFTYKAAPAYGVNFYMFNGNWTTTIGGGMRTYKPKQDIFYYAFGDNDYGTITYSNFRSYMAYLGGAYNFEVSEGLRLFAGANMGAYQSKFLSHSVDARRDDTQDINEQELYGAIKGGINLGYGEHIQVNIQGAYNIFATTGKTEYYSRTGTVYNSISTGLGIIYKF